MDISDAAKDNDPTDEHGRRDIKAKRVAAGQQMLTFVSKYVVDINLSYPLLAALVFVQVCARQRGHGNRIARHGACQPCGDFFWSGYMGSFVRTYCVVGFWLGIPFREH